MLELKNIYAGYRKGHWILEDIDLHIGEGETLGVIGKNGSGKSTLAKAILNLAPQRIGQIIFNGKDISKLSTPEIIQRKIGFFVQGGAVFDNLTVKENLTFAGRTLKPEYFEKRLKEIENYILFLGNESILHLRASYLSGGEKHLLALAMVLMQKPRFIILDEPSAGLSISNVSLLYVILKNICKAENLTLMLIEQNLPKVFSFAGRIIRIRNRIVETVDTTTEKEIMMNEFIIN